MRIAFVVPDLHKKGGIQTFAKLVYSELNRKLEIDIINWDFGLNLIQKGLINIPSGKLGEIIYKKIISKDYKRRYSCLDEYDLIHFWHPEPAMAFIDKDYIVSVHGMEILPVNIKYFRKPLYKKVFENAIVIHVNSNYTKNLLISLFNVSEEKIKVIHPPIDYERLSSYNKYNKVNKNKIVIGTLTRFNKRKNIPNIIKALNILREDYNLDFVYYLAGEGLERKRILRELKRAKFEWKYFGEISEEKKLKEFYPSLDVFVLSPLELPNDVEGFGIVYLEANAYGIPVVAAKTGGVTDAVKEGVSGVFADPTNPQDIAEKILKVLKNKNKYLKSTKEWAKKFDIKTIASEIIKMYEVII